MKAGQSWLFLAWVHFLFCSQQYALSPEPGTPTQKDPTFHMSTLCSFISGHVPAAHLRSLPQQYPFPELPGASGGQYDPGLTTCPPTAAIHNEKRLGGTFGFHGSRGMFAPQSQGGPMARGEQSSPREQEDEHGRDEAAGARILRVGCGPVRQRSRASQ